MSIFNEPIDGNLVNELNLRQDLMGKKDRTPIELTFLNSNNTFVKLQSSVNLKDTKKNTQNDQDPPKYTSDIAKQNILWGGLIKENDIDGKISNQIASGVGAGINTLSAGYSYNIKTADDQLHELGLKPMPGITSLKIESIGAYGSVRKATVNFQCWDIKQLEILEALYMRPGYTVLLEYGRNSYLRNNKLIDTKLKNNFFSEKNINLQQYLSNLYKTSLFQNGHYDAFFGYVVNYKWAYRSDGGYDCMTEIISTGEVAESIKLNYSAAGAVKYTAFGDPDTSVAASAPFKGLILPKITSKIAPSDIIRFNDEYSENLLSGLIYELYTVCRYEQDSGSIYPAPQKTSVINIPKRYIDRGNIVMTFARLQYASNSESSKPSTNTDPGFLFGNDNYFIDLEAFCDIITEYNLPYAYDSNFQTPNGSLTAISTNSRTYTKSKSERDPLLCLYNNLMISTNPDVCWIDTKKWMEIAKGAKINLDATPPPLPISSPYLAAEYTQYLTDKINQWINQVYYDQGITTEKPRADILNDIASVRDHALRLASPFNNNQLATKQEFYKAIQAIYQTIRGGFDSTGLRNWVGLKQTTSKFPVLRDKLRSSFNSDSGTFSSLISAVLSSIFTPDPPVLDEIQTLANTPDPAIDQRLQEQAPVIEQIQKAIDQQNKTNQNLNEIDKLIEETNKYFLSFKHTPPSGSAETSESNFGEIGKIYINLKHAYYLAKSPDLLSSDPSGKNVLSLGKYFDTFIQNIQTSLGNVNNFGIHIDPIDGVARIVDINYINKDKSPKLFKFEIGSNKTIARDIKLESQVFSNQMSMIAISAQAEPGKLAYDNTTTTSYNDEIIDRNIPAKDNVLIKVDNAAKELNFISNLAYLVNKYLKNLYEGFTSVDIVGGTSAGTAPTTPAAQLISSVNKSYDANLANSYSNSLRDLIAYISSLGKNYSDNANKALLPTQLSLTIDGTSGLVIGNLFKVDNNFIPKFYKNSARNLGYTITGLNHEVINGDWTTTIQAYPVDLSSNTVKSTDVNLSGSIVYIGGDGTPRVDNGDCGQPTENIIPFLSGRNRKKISYNSGMSDPRVSPIFYEDFVNDIVPFFEQYADFTFIYSATGKRPKNPGSAHPTGNAVDIQINGINKAKISNQWKGTKYANWNDFRAQVNSGGNYSVEYDTSSPNRNHPYNQSQIGSIMTVHRGLISKFQGTKARGAFYYDLRINGRQYRVINEYLHPVTYSEGPHFHIMRICGGNSKSTSGGAPSGNSGSSTSSGRTPSTTPSPSQSKPIPSATRPNNQPQPSQTPSATPSPSSKAPIPSQFSTPTPTPTPTITPSNKIKVMDAPSTKSSWKFPYIVDIMLAVDGTPGNDATTLNRLETGNGNWVGGRGTISNNITNLDTEVNIILRKMYSDGIKPKVTNVDFGDYDHEVFNNLDGSVTKVNIHFKITINESDDGLAWTGFKSRKKASSNSSDINDLRFFENQKSINLLSQVIQEITSEYGSFPRKGPSPVGDIKFVGNAFTKPQIWYRHIFFNYTDKNPEGTESK
jgi:hypothetical protein